MFTIDHYAFSPVHFGIDIYFFGKNNRLCFTEDLEALQLYNELDGSLDEEQLTI